MGEMAHSAGSLEAISDPGPLRLREEIVETAESAGPHSTPTPTEVRKMNRLANSAPGSQDHRREHAEEMVGVLLAAAADDDAQVRAPKPVAWALRFGQHTANSADLVAGALRIRSQDGAEPHPAGGLVLVDGARPALERRAGRGPAWSPLCCCWWPRWPMSTSRRPRPAASPGIRTAGLTAALGLADLPLAAGDARGRRAGVRP